MLLLRNLKSETIYWIRGLFKFINGIIVLLLTNMRLNIYDVIINGLLKRIRRHEEDLMGHDKEILRHVEEIMR